MSPLTPRNSFSLLTFLLVLASMAFYASNARAAATYFKAYAKAPYETSSTVYTLQVDGHSVDVAKYFKKYSYAHLAYEGTATFVVSLKSGDTIVGYNVSPHSYNISASKSGNHLTFSLAQADSTYLVI